MAKSPAGGIRGFVPRVYGGFAHTLENNILYLANLTALEEWYRWVRKDFLDMQEFGSSIYDGLMETLSAAKKERLKRLKTMAEKAQASASFVAGEQDAGPKRELPGKMAAIEEIFIGKTAAGTGGNGTGTIPDRFPPVDRAGRDGLYSNGAGATGGRPGRAACGGWIGLSSPFAGRSRGQFPHCPYLENNFKLSEGELSYGKAIRDRWDQGGSQQISHEFTDRFRRGTGGCAPVQEGASPREGHHREGYAHFRDICWKAPWKRASLPWGATPTW